MFIVLEIQKQNNETASVLPFVFLDKPTAENKYHTVLAYAAMSDVPVHSAMMIDEFGTVLKLESYVHESESQEPIE